MVRFGRHSKERMKKYNVKEEDVQDCLKNPDRTVTGYEERNIAEKSVNSYILRVIYDIIDDEEVVITVYKAKKKRYWGGES